MFEYDWFDKDEWKQRTIPESFVSRLSSRNVRRSSLLYWGEHCSECAAPLCFTSCRLYTPRADGDCKRLSYGVYPNPEFNGLFNHGADVAFRRWGRLASMLGGRSVPIWLHRLLVFLDFAAVRSARSRPLAGRASWRLPVSRGLAWLRRHTIDFFRRQLPGDEYDAFIIECFSTEPQPITLILEIWNHLRLSFRHSFSLEPGANFCELPASLMNLERDLREFCAVIYPELKKDECRLIFTWLDFVKYRYPLQSSQKRGGNESSIPAEKVKCVAWDLDDTVWKGILAETRNSQVALNDAATTLIKDLDQRGFLQTVVSKNNHDYAWSKLKSFNLDKYFLHPAINWDPKSTNLEQIARKLNIGLDSFALIDDSAFERAEVRTILPQVRVYSEQQIETLLQLPEFNVRISEESANRRAQYRANIERMSAQPSCFGDYEEFLRNCEMHLHVFRPSRVETIERCLELISRSNQQNLSNQRYTAEEFSRLLSTKDILNVALQCKDRFGDYGVVGFASVDERTKIPLVTDFVLSCRVIQKRIEHTFFNWLAEHESGRGAECLQALFVPTEKNHLVSHFFDDTPFSRVSVDDKRTVMELRLNKPVLKQSVMKIEVEF